jgi:multiple sugar transport system ATP-binding protein
MLGVVHPEQTMASIRFSDVSKVYADGGPPAVADLDLEIEDGEFVVLVGPSGSGKSTALRMLAGLEDLSSGEIRIDDRVVNGLAPRDRDIAMVFQNYALYPHMTVRDNLGFALKLEHMKHGEIDERVRQAAGILELDALLDRKPAQLSGGQRQRVAMGRAIVRQPKAFLMDEPLSNLDAKLRVQTREVIADLQERLQVTTVYVTHDQTEALTLGDRIALLRLGRLQQFGTPDDVYLRPANVFVAGFIGSPSMNFVPGVVRDGAVDVRFARLPIPAGAKREQEVIVGLRPEDLEPADGSDGDAVRFAAVVETVESTGADLYAHARIEGGLADSTRLDELVSENAESGPSRSREGELRIVARLDPAIGARPGTRLMLRADPERIYLFDAGSGEALTGAHTEAGV